MVALSRRAPPVPRIVATGEQLAAEWDALLVGVVPLAFDSGARRLELLPGGTVAGSLGPIVLRGLEQEVADNLARVLAEDGRWDELVLSPVSAHEAEVGTLFGAFRQLGAVQLTITGAAPVVPVPPSWDDYLAALPVGQAGEVRRVLRAFDDWTGGHADLRVARTARELATGLEVFRSLEGGARGLDEELLPALLSGGVLELMWLSAHGQPVAALCNLVWRDRVIVCRGAHLSGPPAGVRADLVIRALAVRRAIELGRCEIEFPAGRPGEELAVAVRPLGQLRVVRQRSRFQYTSSSTPATTSSGKRPTSA